MPSNQAANGYICDHASRQRPLGFTSPQVVFREGFSCINQPGSKILWILNLNIVATESGVQHWQGYVLPSLRHNSSLHLIVVSWPRHVRNSAPRLRSSQIPGWRFQLHFGIRRFCFVPIPDDHGAEASCFSNIACQLEVRATKPVVAPMLLLFRSPAGRCGA
uniref:Uncharacterized protein n=1 Tax=Coccidioides posadasii RMSCC 3488 TaxID=454284 RepID=A0A0J6F4L9_COCPO|nr:hypothetical protein CPAG_04194 [Coccidioides posadasii RMSCC 3488]